MYYDICKSAHITFTRNFVIDEGVHGHWPVPRCPITEDAVT